MNSWITLYVTGFGLCVFIVLCSKVYIIDRIVVLSLINFIQRYASIYINPESFKVPCVSVCIISYTVLCSKASEID